MEKKVVRVGMEGIKVGMGNLERLLASEAAKGNAVLTIRQPLSVPEALALVREGLPATTEGRGWALYAPTAAIIPCRPAVDIATPDGMVKAGEVLALNFAWRVGSRVLLRCAASATPGGRRDALFPVDFYEEQLGHVAGVAGVPLHFPGWQLVNQDLLAGRPA